MQPNAETKINLTLTFIDDNSECTTNILSSSIGGSMNWIGEDLGTCNQPYRLTAKTSVRFTGINSKLVNKTEKAYSLID